MSVERNIAAPGQQLARASAFAVRDFWVDMHFRSSRLRFCTVAPCRSSVAHFFPIGS